MSRRSELTWESRSCRDVVLRRRAREGEAVRFTRVSMGNPHAVVFVDSAGEGVPLEDLAFAVAARHDLFPDGVNVEAVHVAEGARLFRARVFERGCGETGACGTGACAAVVAHRIHHDACRADRPVKVCMAGGPLLIEWRGLGEPVYMTGPAEQVFTGEVDVSRLLGLML